MKVLDRGRKALLKSCAEAVELKGDSQSPQLIITAKEKNTLKS